MSDFEDDNESFGDDASFEDNNSGSDEGDSEVDEPANEKRKRNGLDGPQPYKKVKYEDITENGAAKKGKKKNKQPTVEELSVLKETENLYNSGLFRLQIEELIKATKIKEKHQRIFKTWFEKFQSITNNLPEHSDVILSSLETQKSGKKSNKNNFLSQLAKCKTNIKCDQDINMMFIKPNRSDIFGLYKLEAQPGPCLEVSINVQIPKACFHAKDYLNNRYFVKRYYYLMYIANALKNDGCCAKLEVVHHQDIDLLPILQVTLANSDKIQVNVYATPEVDTFKPSRFLPDKNNVKENVFKQQFCDVDEEIMKWTETVFYNAILQHDVTLKTNNDYIEESLDGLNNVQEAVKIINIWAKQRDMFSSCISLTRELVLYIVTYLVKQKKVNKYMSSYQVVRTFWNFLIHQDFRQKPIYLADDVSPDALVGFQNNYDVVFLDRTGCYNVASLLSEGWYEKLIKECELALALVDNGGLQGFHSLFITKIPVSFQYDVIVNIKSTTGFENVLKCAREQEKAKYFGRYQSLVVNSIWKVLRTGFNKRATLIVPYMVPVKPWEFDKCNNEPFDTLIFGINLDPEFAFNFLERGPALNDPKEKEFRDFWGRLSSDRRFRDGTACVAVYIETKTVKDRRDIIKKITRYLIREKLKLKYTLSFSEIEDVLVHSNIKASYDIGTNEEPTLKAMQASDNLAKIIRDLDLSLSVSGIQGMSSVFSYTECYPPIQTSYRCGKTVTKSEGHNIILSDSKINVVPKYVQPIECVLQFERSSKWPSDLQAIHYTIQAFYLEMSKLLQQKHKIVCSVKREHLDIFYEGLVFRYRLYVPKEVHFLRQAVDVGGSVEYQDTPESTSLENKLNLLPQVRGALKGVQSQYPSYGPSTALIKRWLNAHLLDEYLFPSIVAELLNASLYVNSSPYLPSQTPQIAFYRFLKFFSELHWDLQPVIVNFNDILSKDKVAEMEQSIESNRGAYPHLCILTPYDTGISSLTRGAPLHPVLFRVKKMSEFCVKLFEEAFIQNTVNFRQLFVPNLSGYSLKIHLKPLMNPRRHEQIVAEELKDKLTLEPYDAKVSQLMPIVEFNPAEAYLKELRDNYGEYAVFFHDSYGGNMIGVLWKPEALASRPFKVASVCGKKLDADKLVLNVDSLIEDFYILGKDIIKQIEK